MLLFSSPTVQFPFTGIIASENLLALQKCRGLEHWSVRDAASWSCYVLLAFRVIPSMRLVITSRSSKLRSFANQCLASFVPGLGMEEVDGITWSSVWEFGGLCVEKQGNIWRYIRERKEKQRIPMIVIVHTVVIIIKCQYDCRCCCSEAWCTCTMLSTAKLRGDAVTRGFTSLSCWINSGDIFSRICLVVGDDGDFLRYVQMKCVESSFRSFVQFWQCVHLSSWESILLRWWWRHFQKVFRCR